ncbi:Protein NLRC5 [Holothuria leucospilota]|uniref:Protein NLRC5 n=1 Tax=Holothuria leucospilota TaxID=206669 RepID=A0A9Q1HFW6_HOLLE|nr:Protein NLRC5 [Holothuria leucospilota]
MDMKDKKILLITQLRNKYTNLCGGIPPVPFLRDKYNIDELFIECRIEFLEGKQRGSCDHFKWKKLKGYKEIFTDSRVKAKRRIIDGEPGYGKSILALQITNDWCQKVPPMNDVEILILLRLRQLKNMTSLFSGIKKLLLPKDSTLTDDDIKGILDNSLVMLLLDGYDEYPDRGNKDSDIEAIIRGDMLQNHDVVLMTRTSCLPLNPSVDTKRIKLTGFDDAAKLTYIKNVVTHNDLEKADKIRRFFSENLVPADLCRVPLFFVMISHMAHENKAFQNLKTVTEIFRRVVACFHSHEQIRRADANTVQSKRPATDHGQLDKVAFDGLIGDPQQITWGRDELRDKVGVDLYSEYVRIGILQEDEVFDDDAIDFKTETRFFHNVFLEWYAAHYLANEAVRPEAELEPNWKEKLHSLKSLNPRDVQYMYRYACGLNHDAALKIIQLLGECRFYGQCTLMCITEWGGSLDAIEKTVTSLCSRDVHINDRDSLLLQKSTAELLEFASERKIPISSVWLDNCLDSGSMSPWNLHFKKLNMPLPVMTTLKKLVVWEEGLVITEEVIAAILQYLSTCMGLRESWLSRCLLPRSIKVMECMSVLKERNVEVWWVPAGIKAYVLNLDSGLWEKHSDFTPITDEVYQRAASIIQGYAEWRKKRENSKP